MSHVYTCVHVCVCAFMWGAEIDYRYLLLISPSVFDKGSFYWIWCLISDWLASQPQGSTCLYLCSTGITGLCFHVGFWGERNWGCELKRSYLCSKELTHRIISLVLEIIVLLCHIILLSLVFLNGTMRVKYYKLFLMYVIFIWMFRLYQRIEKSMVILPFLCLHTQHATIDTGYMRTFPTSQAIPFLVTLKCMSSNWTPRISY